MFAELLKKMVNFLRPRTKGPPSDHNYSTHNSGGLVYVNQAVGQVSVTDNLQDGEQLGSSTVQTASSPQSCVKRKKRKRRAYYDFEPKRKRVKRRLPSPSQGSSEITQETPVQDGEITDLKCAVPTSNEEVNGLKGKSVRAKKRSFGEGSRRSERLLTKHMKLPFDYLPNEMKLKIFAYLNPEEKSRCRLVCKEWNVLSMDPDAWPRIDYNLVGESFGPKLLEPTRQWRKQRSQRALYEQFQRRVQSFNHYIASFHLMPTSITASFDVGNYMDNWGQHLIGLITLVNMSSLREFNCDWQTTMYKPPHIERYCCVYNKVRTLFRLHILRVPVFHKLLDTLSRKAPRVTRIVMPFDWSPRSGLLLSRFKHLETLKLRQYISLPDPQPEVLSALLKALPCLTHLELTIVIPTFDHKILYELCHAKLETLQLVKCQGFFLQKLNLPLLQSISMDRVPWEGFTSDRQGNQLAVPCLADVLSQGAPNLNMFNGHKWLHGVKQQEQNFLLKQYCPCSVHWNDTDHNER